MFTLDHSCHHYHLLCYLVWDLVLDLVLAAGSELARLPPLVQNRVAISRQKVLAWEWQPPNIRTPALWRCRDSRRSQDKPPPKIRCQGQQ